jgi:hypothetical protein
MTVTNLYRNFIIYNCKYILLLLGCWYTPLKRPFPATLIIGFIISGKGVQVNKNGGENGIKDVVPLGKPQIFMVLI